MTRSGLLVCPSDSVHFQSALTFCTSQSARPKLLEDIVQQLKFMCGAGVTLNIHTARALTLGHIETYAPELLTVQLGDETTFTCSDVYVRKFLKQHLNYVPRAATCAHQKIPDNADELIRCSIFRIVHTCWKRKICHPELYVNFDQTQVHVQATGNSTFAELGAKQVSITGKEEKRAWTALVGVLNAGTVLPLQIIMEVKIASAHCQKKTHP
jgi:hypothetical protein